MLVRRGLSIVALILVAGCGGKVLDDSTPLSPKAPASNPPVVSPTSSPVSPPPTHPTTTPPVAPIPKGEPGTCGLYSGDGEANLKSFGAARALGVYEVVDVVKECSGAGGTHVTLALVVGCSGQKIVHYGDHVCMIDWQKGDRAVIGVDPASGSAKNLGWCLDSLAPWDGSARAVRKLAANETTTSALNRYGCSP